LNIKKIVSNKTKNKIKYLISINHHIYDKYNKKKKIVVCLSADYGNLGDVAISITQLEFLKKTFPEYEVFEFPISETYKNMKSLKSIIKKNDIITIVGGGNTSSRYQDIEDCRQFVIKKFKNNIVISFPQSIDLEYMNDKFLKQMRKVYSKHKNFYYFVREKYSYEFIKENLPCINCYLQPDIVLFNKINTKKNMQTNIILSLRRDKEKKLNIESQKSIISIIENLGNIKVLDTQFEGEFNYDLYERRKILNNLLSSYRDASLIITDRLHGMIFSYICNTPCIVFACDNQKIEGVYQFLKSSKKIRYYKDFNIDEFKNAVLYLMSNGLDDNQPIEFNNFQKTLKEIIK